MSRQRSVIADGEKQPVLPCGWEGKLMLLCSNLKMTELKMRLSLDREVHFHDFIPWIQVHAHTPTS